MTDWTDLDTTDDLGPEAIVTTSTMEALYNNPIAITEGAPGAPKIQTSAIESDERMTTTNVRLATAGVDNNQVGSYAFAACDIDRNFGQTVSASNLTPSSAGIASGSMSGTWRCMGHADADTGTTGNNRTLWLRIS